MSNKDVGFHQVKEFLDGSKTVRNFMYNKKKRRTSTPKQYSPRHRVKRQRMSHQSINRARNKILDIVRSNPFTHCFTITLDPKLHDRRSFNSVDKKLSKIFAKRKKKFRNSIYCYAVDFHEDNAIHIHGVLNSVMENAAKDIFRNQSLEMDPEIIGLNNLFFNEFGISEFKIIEDIIAVAVYMTKYYGLDHLDRFIGFQHTRLYASSRNLKKPKILSQKEGMITMPEDLNPSFKNKYLQIYELPADQEFTIDQ